MASAAVRATREVVADHLDKQSRGLIEEDLALNYSPAALLVVAQRLYRGHAGLRHLWRQLAAAAPGARFEFGPALVHGAVAVVDWRAAAAGRCLAAGTDSFVVESGQIIAQATHLGPAVAGGVARIGMGR